MTVLTILLCMLTWAVIFETCCEQPACFFETCVECDQTCDDNAQYTCANGQLFGKTFYSFRPQDSDSSRRILGYFNNYYINNYHNNSYGVYHPRVTIQYERSFNTTALAPWFFFNGTNCMTVGIPGAGQIFTIDGSQIGLSLGNNADMSLLPGPIGAVCAKPLVSNLIVDFDFQYDFTECLCGFWTRINFAVVRMKTDLGLVQSGAGENNDDFPAGLFSVENVGDSECATTPVPYTCVIAALEGQKGWGSVRPLFCGKFSSTGLVKTGVAGLHLDIGYDFYEDDCLYCAASIHTVFPTGSRPHGHFLFEPVIGANKSWQIGATILTDYTINIDDEMQLGFYGYAIGTHLFKSKQRRVFALNNNGPGSQLLLLKKFNPTDTKIKSAERVANILCGETKIGANLMFDGSIMAQCTWCDYVVDLGYNFWVRTREKRSDTVCLRGFYEDQLGIKGNEPLMSEDHTGCPLSALFPTCAYNLNTASQSTIGQPALADPAAVFLQPSDIAFGSALHPTTWSNKIFGAVGFNKSWFCMLAGEVEFGKKNSAINQWSIMLKIGKDF